MNTKSKQQLTGIISNAEGDLVQEDTNVLVFRLDLQQSCCPGLGSNYMKVYQGKG